DATSSEQGMRRLKHIADQFALTKALSTDGWPGLLRALGAHQVGEALIKWWETHANAYTRAYAWVGKRHESYGIINDLHQRLETKAEVFEISISLKTAADRTEVLARDIEHWLKRLTQWCAPFGQQLLLAHRTGQPGLPMDPL